MKTYLNVPFEEKDEAKALGAWFDGAKKRWYVRDKANLQPFVKWMDARIVRPHKQRMVKVYERGQAPIPAARKRKFKQRRDVVVDAMYKAANRHMKNI